MSKEANKLLDKHSHINNRVEFGEFGTMVKMSDSIKAIDEAIQQVKNDVVLGDVIFCEDCNNIGEESKNLGKVLCDKCFDIAISKL